MASDEASDPTVTASRANGDTHGSGDTTGRRPARGQSIERGTLVGRYTVIEEIGAGGMGVVYLAYDPELDRRVALKFLLALEREIDDLGGARLLREAKAIAQVAHPNVVAVYDVDTFRGDVYVAMEYVDGVPIGEWIHQQRRSTDEVLDAFVQAGEGLAAAHERGVVHRDFKPHNVLVGNDGRVRVLDFGLAYTGNEPPPVDDGAISPAPSDPMDRLTETGVVMGTPAYMSPEQNAGLPTDARSDQFSFCMTLCEALTGNRPRVLEGIPGVPAAARRELPGWLVAVLERGLQDGPDQRYPSMRARLGDILRGRRRRGRRLAAIGVSVVAATVVAGTWATRPGHSDPCAGAGAAVDAVWTAERRDRIARAFRDSGVPYAADTLAKVTAALDRYGADYRAHSRDACRATHVRHEQSAARMDLRMDCLNRRLRDLDALVDAFGRATPEVVANAAPATQELPPLDDCRDVEGGPPLPVDPEARAEVAAIRDQLAVARAARTTGDLRATRTLLAPLATRAAAVDHAATRAEVATELGLTLAALDEDDDARDQLGHAYLDAVASGDSHLELATAAELAVLAARGGDFQESERWVNLVRALESGTGDRDDRARALEALGEVERIRGQLDEAAALLERAVAIRRQQDRPALLAHALLELGRVHTDNDDPAFRTYVSEAEQLLVSIYGANHPAALAVWIDLEDQEQLERVLAIDDRDHVLSPRQRCAALRQLARLVLEQDRFTDGTLLLIEAAALARTSLGEHSLELGLVDKQIALAFARRGDFDTAIGWGRLGVDQIRHALGPDHPQVARSLNNLGMDLSYNQRKDEALAIFEEAMAILDRHSGGRYYLRGNLLNNIAIVYDNRNDIDRAVELYKASAEARARGLGDNHPKVGDSYTNLGSLMMRLDRLDEAEAYQRKALAIYEKAYAGYATRTGHEHRDIAWPLTELGGIALERKRPADAVPLFERALAIRLAANSAPRFLGKTQFWLAEALWEVGEHDRALELADQAKATFERGNTANERTWLDDLAAWRRRIRR